MPLIYSDSQERNRLDTNGTTILHNFRTRLPTRTQNEEDTRFYIRRRLEEVLEDSDSEEEDEEDETRLFPQSPIDLYRLAIRTNSEILQDLASIIRILRQMNAIYRIFNHTQDEDDEEEANKLLEAGLADLQSMLSAERKRQSTLALLALLTYRRHHHHCLDQYLRQYLDPDGDYDPRLAMFAAAIYDDCEDSEPKSCRNIMMIAEDMSGPNWLDEFHKEKEGVLRKMLEKLSFVAKVRLRLREEESDHACVVR
ncbi:hypothetical protein G6F57_012109 [Rhizopus arrhizus]|uniref:Uncharacterized protein n=1 Tax=Rhizopus oryzae TaxID=64495 RepID=A0A9P6WYY9_RHIOR|nr:hypothetical protein G6F23_009336 [Rhizopus arrhizus]KAG1403848.1 hypothetical protein G6F58_010295 [Rhizopus delemar]KAG0755545.1 hypothetical protein G6F24_011763 [Rhizopus arrhizus]KAG0787111.1 hypothetical protein G6F21_008127 [Rhizopus arrhizus]KAG0798327.1 hypothetical protein G6F22_004336 [Rhizopus arrhizus]